MNRPTAFLGTFARSDPRAPGQTMHATIAFPRGEYGPVIQAFGAPDPDVGPSVAVIPCRHPYHPFGDADVMLLAFLRESNRLLDSGKAGLGPETLQEISYLLARMSGRQRRLDITAPPPATAPERL
ncbi:hypothetical protein [Methylobacterium sp. 1973]|uniref:hypothetical protein n=1 Tax=Methylobacterium sp. 1973 TaxID=3156421 RepID=UPI00339616AD